MGVLPTMEGSVLSRRERNRSLTHRRLGAATGVHIRLFNPHVSSIIGEKCPEELAKLSNVIRDNRARLGSMREKNNPDKSAPDTEQSRDKPDLAFNKRDPARWPPISISLPRLSLEQARDARNSAEHKEARKIGDKVYEIPRLHR